MPTTTARPTKYEFGMKVMGMGSPRFGWQRILAAIFTTVLPASAQASFGGPLCAEGNYSCALFVGTLLSPLYLVNFPDAIIALVLGMTVHWPVRELSWLRSLALSLISVLLANWVGAVALLNGQVTSSRYHWAFVTAFSFALAGSVVLSSKKRQ